MKRTRKWDEFRLSVASVFNQVSTRPPASSYIWGGRVSPLPFLAFHAVYLLRLLSPLQWIKFWVRTRATRRPTTNRRSDFPSAFTEWYFIVVLSLAGTGYVVRNSFQVAIPRVILSIVFWLLIIECTTWILYYLLLRGFVETNYTIFHPAEYLLTFPLVVFAQLLLLCFIFDRGLADLLMAAILNPDRSDSLGISVSMLSVVYFGVAVSVVLSSHPGIRTRSSQNIVILGAGEVTSNRIVPALISLGYARDDLLVVTVDKENLTQWETDRREQLERIVKVQSVPEVSVMETSLRERSPTIIASPTYAHFSQLIDLADSRIPFAVEKPITSSRSERDTLLRNPGLMQRGFALSYYTLEKSLPLTYIFDPLPIYARFLRSDQLNLQNGEDVANLRTVLGVVKSIKVVLLEGPDRSPSGKSPLWTEIPGTIHQFVETTIHPLILIRRLLRSSASRQLLDLQWELCALGRYGPREQEINSATGELIAPTWIIAKGVAGDVDISMETGKYAPETRAKRQAEIEFMNGSCLMDFDTRRASFYVNNGRAGWIEIDTERVRSRYAANYAVLMALFGEFALNGWGPVRFDDYANQLDALHDWDVLCDLVEENNVPTTCYDDDIPLSILTSLRH